MGGGYEIFLFHPFVADETERGVQASQRHLKAHMPRCHRYRVTLTLSVTPTLTRGSLRMACTTGAWPFIAARMIGAAFL